MSKLVELAIDEKAVFNLTTLGELLVLGVSIIQSEYDETLDLITLVKALEFMQKRHPLMRANLHFDSNRIFFNINDALPIDIREDIEYEQLDSRDVLNSKLEFFNTKLFDYKNNKKLWRACCYAFDTNQYAVGILMPLFVTDGINITTLLIELVNIVNSLINKTECVEMQENLEMIENLDVLVEKQNLLQEKQLEHIKMLQSQPRLDFKLSPKFKCYNQSGFKLNLFNIDSDLTAKVIELNKLNNSKITSYLVAIAFYALRSLYLENNLFFPKDVTFGLATNVRFRLNPNVDFSHIRSLTTYLEPRLIYPEFGLFSNVWDDVAFINKVIAEVSNMDSGSLFMYSHDREHSDELNKLFENNLDKDEIISLLNSDNNSDMGISNIGTYVFNKKKQNPEKPFKIIETYFTDSLCNTRSCLCSCLFYHVSYWNGKLMFALTSNKASIGTPFTERLVELFKLEVIQSLESFYQKKNFK